ncbi:hypothetical protein [Botrimarina mediterranea]|uniref:hypothetical protein n=1 Tax=Botrimarina mediterranea TaxID=2528022 RepID=UPI00119E0C1E
MSETRVQTVLLAVGCVLLLAILVVTVSPPPAGSAVAAHPLGPRFLPTIDETDGYIIPSEHEQELLRSINSAGTIRANQMTEALSKAIESVVEREAEHIRGTIKNNVDHVVTTINDNAGYVIQAVNRQ